ncbi:MAG: hypothetical protein LKF74_04185 [Megasphaera sp.]|jgi:hypothetical protein|nr:hypothetical protein [Megasphaera sp.]MCH4187539.1 hypothetical protein [Megasphaera sp.]MCH4217737.1 hypothetical protein [Megasphaera sp.]
MKSKKMIALAVAMAMSSTMGVFAENTTPIEGKAALAGTETTVNIQSSTGQNASKEKPANPAPPEAPGGQQPPAGPQSQGKDISAFTAAKIVDGSTEELSDSFVADQADQNSLLVKNGANVTVKNSAFDKSGNTTSGDGSNFNGQNATILSSNSTVSIDGCSIKSNADGANAVFSTGSASKVTVHDTNIRTKGNSSRGLDATYGGTVTANNINIGTEGAHCAALATDRGEGTVTVSQSTLNTAGEGSPVVYSTGNITLTESKGTATGSEIAVIEGKNSINLEYVDLTGSQKHGVMLYQSFSGDAGVGTASFSAKHSSLHNKSDGPMFYVTNTKARAYLEMTDLEFSSPTLIQVTSDQWGNAGSNGGDFTFVANQQALSGNVLANHISKVALSLENGSTWTGAINGDNAAAAATVSIDSSSTWTVNGTCYITALTDADTTLSNITGNGNTIYYTASNEANQWLGGKTYDLSGGGQLKPVV